ncbi:hypothetical protein [Ekhidna sp.]|uniref:hypothetical protein n=1 Tax=Ekhidna sp. TaxID=2608089 RepID=UPI003296ABA2
MNEILLILFGIVLGVIAIYFKGYLSNLKAERSEIKNPEYLKSKAFNKLKGTIRHIVVEYSIRRKNNDFLLNVFLNEVTLFQITHRFHYPEILKNQDDMAFGLALYLPINKLNSEQKKRILNIMKEEADYFSYEEIPFDYYVVDFGKRIKYSSYFIVRLLKEIFLIEDEDDISFELFSEGNLPYRVHDH